MASLWDPRHTAGLLTNVTRDIMRSSMAPSLEETEDGCTIFVSTWKTHGGHAEAILQSVAAEARAYSGRHSVNERRSELTAGVVDCGQ